jgi:ribosomal protein S18 acetylase RimI-like enzyme
LASAQQRVADTGGIAMVAERDGCVVGHLFVVVEDDAVFVREELRRHAHVSELFVRADARGSGVGKALMAEAQRFAAARGFKRLSVTVLAGNLPAVGAYERLGFTPYTIDLTKPIDRT